uniref:probable esterase PIR7A n=1 Tax=Fragaria vesca subsp. vesca TaxID=101020 RepID=UPI0005C91EF0|nr:PREDICTED: probable esterase PIR7A [Fragaria vesca subsp. vesca]XP_011465430.1 PREDICTED: probable esterase PIR7A [Fragaria vesca subsp. vesca]
MMKIENMRVKQFVVPFALLVCLVTMCSNSITVTSDQYPSQILNGKKQFVLVHGANHGAWCWYKLATLLNSTGHNVTALDLAASGINPIKVEQVHSFSEYVEPLITFLGSLAPKERVILVGHSSGGAVISFAMERFPERIAVAVYASAVMPGPSLSYLTISAKLIPRWVNFNREKQGYQLSPPEDLTLASTLVKPTPTFSEEIKLTEEKYGLVPRVFIMSDQDLTIQKDIQMWMIRENPPNEVKVINGSDHMVMFSRPLELFSHLLQIAEKYSHEDHHHGY